MRDASRKRKATPKGPNRPSEPRFAANIARFYVTANSRYRPDFLVHFSSGGMLVLEERGRESDRDRIKFRFLDEWARTVNAHGGFGRWCLEVSTNPADVREIHLKNSKGDTA